MRAGKLRHRIIIQMPTETRDSFGGVTVVWNTFAIVSGSVEPLRGQELWAAQAQQARVNTRIRIRYLAGITSKMRVLYGVRIYLIDSVIDPEERHIEMQLMAEEWAAT